MPPLVFRRTAGLWIPCVAVVCVAVVALAGTNAGVTALLGVAAAVAVLLWTLMGVTGRVVIQDRLLRVHGGPPFNGYNGRSRPVDLSSLSRCYAVAVSRYGAEVRLWPIRTIAILEDAHGGRQQLPMQWWSRSLQLRAILRESAIQNAAICDVKVAHWLGGIAGGEAPRVRLTRRKVTGVRIFGRNFTR